MARQIAKNPDGTLTVDGKYQIGKNDPRFPKFSGMYDTQRAQPTGVSVTGQGGVYTSGTGQRDLQYNYNEDGFTRTVDGKQYYVPKGDPREASIRSDYANQNGGIYASGTVNDPTGFSNVKGYYEEALKRSNAAAQGQIDAAVKSLNDSIGYTNSTFDNANKAAYINYMQGQKNLTQQLAASGLGKTGASESTRLAAQSGYQNNVNTNEGARAKAVNDIYNRIAQTQADGASVLANLYSDYAGNMANSYTGMLSSDRNQLNLDRDYRLSEDQYNYQKQRDLQNDAAAYAEMLINSGGTTASIMNAIKQAYPNANITAQDLAVIQAQRNKSLR
ncbi:MAG: hypothetical protein ACOX7J_00285 [Bacillota bacterium]|jgi:hypothetical protein